MPQDSARHPAYGDNSGLRPDRNAKLMNRLNAMFHKKSAIGILLLICTAISVAMASFPATGWFDRMWDTGASFSIGGSEFGMSIRHWINDGLMAVFFLSVGLEIKREMISGQLSSIRKSALPIMAAIGGMAVPAMIYAAFNAGNPETAGGWGIPMATDIAFAIGIISILGDRVPDGLKVFLTALAIVDDLGAIIVLALFYPSHELHYEWLVYAGLIVAMLFFFNRAKVASKWMYIIPGIFLWYCIYKSGVHATIAGVLLAMTIPTQRIARFESKLHPFVNFLIIPLFALANAGVALDFGGFAGNGVPPVALGIFFGLLVGKPAGIFLLSFIGVKSGMAAMPEGVTWSQVAAMGVLGGIGFTMSIFINGLAFSSPEIISIGKMSILLTSAAAATAGLALLGLACKKKKRLTSAAER